MKIANKNVWALGAIVIGLAAIGTLSQVSFGQATPDQSPAVERYRLTVVPSSDDHYRPSVFLLDTKTGRCWVRYAPSSNWNDATPPELSAK